MEGMDGVGGDLVPPGPGNKPSANGTRVYLSCEGIIDEVIGRNREVRRKIVDPKTKIGDMGWIAMIMIRKEIWSVYIVSSRPRSFFIARR